MLPSQLPSIWGLIVVSAALFALAGGIIVGVIIYHSRIRDSERKFKLLFGRVFDAILIIDKDTLSIVDVNEAACDLLGYTREQISDLSLRDLIPDGDLQKVRSTLDRAFDTGSGYMEESTLVSKSGRRIEAEAGLVLCRIADRSYVMGSFRDVTERKRAEEALRNALAEVEQLRNRLQAENIYLQEEIKSEHDFDQIVGRSERLKEVLLRAEQVASTDSAVLILGETGTGKELLARAIHSISARKDRPLVKVDCATLPGSLIESELFGHEKGAFTGAVSRKLGRFELADGGTVFLDEIGDLPLGLQTKLLRVLQEGEFERLGNPKTLKVDVRIIAATNRDLEKAVERGRFREDLYYRLNVFPITIPPLRERNGDIPLFVNHFVLKYTKKTGKRIEVIPQGVMNALEEYHWPGNVRELENIIERSVITSPGNQLELGDWLSKNFLSFSRSRVSTLQEAERELILKTLQSTGWRVSGDKGAARILGMNPKTLESRMRKLEIMRPS